MKTIIIAMMLASIAFSACNSSDNKSGANTDTSNNSTSAIAPASNSKTTVPIKGIVSGYLDLKNALANDNSQEAAIAGKEIVEAMNKIDNSSLTENQKKVYADVQDDAKEHAEHIGSNGGNIKHQREHFDMLSKDMYDIVKASGTGQILYKDYCPMYNDGKGATWLSEVKLIRNPYLGKNMSTCGEVKEEIKQ